MNKKSKILFSLLSIFLFFGFAYGANAATYYWVGGTTNSNTSNTANWNTVAGVCADSGNVTALLAGDTINFVSNCLNDAMIDTASIANLKMNVGYTGTVTVDNRALSVGVGGLSNGALTVDGGNLNIINGGTVIVNSSGGAASSQDVFIGNLAGSNGIITVDGAGSQLSTVTKRISTGISGTGKLVISNGGVVTQASVNTSAIANSVGSIGEIDISGTGSKFSTGGNIYVGSSGAGTMTLSDGAEVILGSRIAMGVSGGSTGTLNIGAGNTTSGIITFTSLVDLFGGSGTGVINVNHNESNYVLSYPITGTLAINQIGAGISTLSGTNTYAGVTTVSDGTLQAGSTSAFGVSNLTVEDGSTLNVGTTGLLLGAGTYTQNNGSTLALTVNDSSVYGSITSSSDAVVAIDSIVNVTVNNPIEDNTALKIIDGAGGVNVFVPNTITDNYSDFSFNGSTDSGDLIITVAYPRPTISGSRPKPKIVVFTPEVNPSITEIICSTGQKYNTQNGQLCTTFTSNPTPNTPTTCLITLTLRQGNTGEQVKCLQTKLNITSDGIFGPITKATVINFQKSHNLVPDGIVGPKTRGAIGEKK